MITEKRMKEILGEVGKNVKEERLKRGLSMAKLAELSNLSVSHISKVESAQCEIGLKALIKISTALSMELVDFLPAIEEFAEKEKIQTNGERFEKIMSGASPKTVEIILQLSDYVAAALGR